MWCLEDGAGDEVLDDGGAPVEECCTADAGEGGHGGVFGDADGGAHEEHGGGETDTEAGLGPVLNGGSELSKGATGGHGGAGNCCGGGEGRSDDGADGADFCDEFHCEVSETMCRCSTVVDSGG